MFILLISFPPNILLQSLDKNRSCSGYYCNKFYALQVFLVFLWFELEGVRTPWTLGPHGPLDPMDPYEVATPSCATKLFLMALNFNLLYGILKINTLK